MKPIVTRSTAFILTGALLLPFSTSQAWAAGAPVYRTLPSASASAPVSLSPVAVAAAKAKLSKEQALQAATRMIPLPQGVSLENASFRSADAWRPFPEWNFNWVKKGKNNEPNELTVNIGINADTGEITSYSFYQKENGSPSYSSRISREVGKQAAERFIAKVASAKAAQTVAYTRNEPEPKTPLGTNVFYSFHYARMVDNILFPENGIDITVDGSGMVTNFSLNWDDSLTFSKPKTILSDKEAIAQLRKTADAKLSYFIAWENRDSGNSQPFLGYANPFTLYLDAASGKPLTTDLKDASKREEPKPASETPLPARNKGGQLDQDDAVRLAQQLFDLSGYELKSVNYNENDYRGNRSIWNLEYQATKKAQEKGQSKMAQPGGLYISLDAKTGDLYSYSKDRGPIMYKEETKKSGSKGDWQSKALETVRNFAPTMANQFYLLSTEPSSKSSERDTYRFQRYVNGIPAGDGNASVTLDSSTGELLDYYLNFGKEQYPGKLSQHLAPEQAVDAWMKEAQPELAYVMVPIENDLMMQMKRGEIAGNSVKREVRLVYRMSVTPSEQPYVLDGVTGEWRSQNSGKPITLHKQAPSDLAGHPAEKELLLMYEYDAISLIDGKIMPDKQITRGEMIEMIMKSIYQGRFSPESMALRKATYSDVANGSRYFASVEAAVDQGLLDKSLKSLKPDEPITRQELADMLVRAMGLKKLSQHSDMFQNKLADIGNNKLRGAITIVTSLGIMEAKNNRFQPTGTVSRSDAAIAFYRFLEKRGEVEDKKDL